MGMFDNIKNELFCPYCGCKCRKGQYQTKDFKQCLDTLDITKIKGVDYNIYTKCNNCYNWIELSILKNYGDIHTLKEGQRLKKKDEAYRRKLFKVRTK